MGKTVKLDSTTEQDYGEQEARAETRTRVVSGAAPSYGFRGRTPQNAEAFSAGTAAFFGREAFGNRPMAPAIRQAVPLGAAQGGFLGKKDADTETALPQAQDGNAHERLLNMADALIRSERAGGGQNSDAFNAVLNSIYRVTAAMHGNLEENQINNMNRLDEMERCYGNLIAACEKYMDRTVLTGKGKARKAMVGKVLGMAQQDLAGLSDVRTDILALSGEELTSTTWDKAVGKARAVRLSVADYSELERPQSGQASDVFKIKKKGTKMRGAEGEYAFDSELKFFKPEDKIDLEPAKGKKSGHAVAMAWAEARKKFPDIPQDDLEYINSVLEDHYQGIPYKLKETVENLSSKGKDAFRHMDKRVKGKDLSVLTEQVLTPMGLAEAGGEINMTRRNVATSRVANMLGMGHLVAKSRTAEIYDEKTGTTVRGNLMDAANGKEFKTAQADYEKGYKTKQEGIAGFTGSFQRDVMSMQVLDVLCGQVDRHASNFLYQMEGSVLTGVQAIDNDAAFGLNTDVATLSFEQRHDRRVYNPKGEMVLPYMDAALAKRMKELEPNLLRAALKDLLRDVEIDAAVERLKKIKEAIAWTETHMPERLLSDDQWGNATGEAVLSREVQLNEARKRYENFRTKENAEKLAHEDARLREVIPEIMEKIDKSGMKSLDVRENDVYNAKLKAVRKEFTDKLSDQYTSNRTALGAVMTGFMNKLKS